MTDFDEPRARPKGSGLSSRLSRSLEYIFHKRSSVMTLQQVTQFAAGGIKFENGTTANNRLK